MPFPAIHDESMIITILRLYIFRNNNALAPRIFNSALSWPVLRLGKKKRRPANSPNRNASAIGCLTRAFSLAELCGADVSSPPEPSLLTSIHLSLSTSFFPFSPIFPSHAIFFIPLSPFPYSPRSFLNERQLLIVH